MTRDPLSPNEVDELFDVIRSVDRDATPSELEIARARYRITLRAWSNPRSGRAQGRFALATLGVLSCLGVAFAGGAFSLRGASFGERRAALHAGAFESTSAGGDLAEHHALATEHAWGGVAKRRASVIAFAEPRSNPSTREPSAREPSRPEARDDESVERSTARERERSGSWLRVEEALARSAYDVTRRELETLALEGSVEVREAAVLARAKLDLVHGSKARARAALEKLAREARAPSTREDARSLLEQ